MTKTGGSDFRRGQQPNLVKSDWTSLGANSFNAAVTSCRIAFNASASSGTMVSNGGQARALEDRQGAQKRKSPAEKSSTLSFSIVMRTFANRITVFAPTCVSTRSPKPSAPSSIMILSRS